MARLRASTIHILLCQEFYFTDKHALARFTQDDIIKEQQFVKEVKACSLNFVNLVSKYFSEILI